MKTVKRLNYFFFGSSKIHVEDALYFYGGMFVPVMMCVYIAFAK